ncbi:uncharacterized protein LAESUDRAFT_484169 [Laetiporus sulphureus 93-53]|uniref:Uncharacterized protein n=1 Tax=Laetiporus sulphureus 93-53 TaxID=1314785 RepID=A0A165BPD7_9APHY|nr:uncharacterized protein LAESUDRAFT_484169 [Laetiporus sulphureus 93-53]KZT01415.1 hypothetical protein LAESUDRAFT_484169 [Laetiporus sulphureus 93-53]
MRDMDTELRGKIWKTKHALEMPVHAEPSRRRPSATPPRTMQRGDTAAKSPLAVRKEASISSTRAAGGRASPRQGLVNVYVEHCSVENTVWLAMTGATEIKSVSRPGGTYNVERQDGDRLQRWGYGWAQLSDPALTGNLDEDPEKSEPIKAVLV